MFLSGRRIALFKSGLEDRTCLAPTEAIYMKICVVGDVLDVITCAKFQNEIFRGYSFTGGSNFPFFLLILNGPYNSAALLRCL